ncbi:intermembrane transport protein PqiB [Plesiomonas shigelloides]|uniref:intermembrane transport protein PqiB n=1 Tax=Plesiomonas shigelloides TaxID=703 RepID=UPI00387F2434
MSHNNESEAQVKKIKQLSPVWIVPIVAIVIGLWMVYYTFSHQGPLITFTANNAEGIVAGKTEIKSRSVQVGTVQTVKLAPDMKHVIITARFNPGTEKMLNDQSQFWVVKPQIGREGVTGLSTLLSGAYIELKPGNTSTRKDEFTLLDSPPIAPADAPGLRIELLSNDASSLNVGDVVLYRGYTVGTVEQSEFDLKARKMRYKLFINAPYDSLVTSNVRFWKSSGVSVDLSAQGVRVDMASLSSLISGGVSFEVPDGWEMGGKVAQNTSFDLYPNQQSITQGLYDKYVPYVLFFDESVRGLSAGAPVEYRGVRIGTVMKVPYYFDNKLSISETNGSVPVLIRLEVGRLPDRLTVADLRRDMEIAVQQGMRAMLKTGNLLTGQLFVDLNMVDNVKKVKKMHEIEGIQVMPTVAGGFSSIELKVQQVLDKLNKLPIEPLLTETTATSKEARKMLQETAKLAATLDKLAVQADSQQLPKELRETLQELRATLNGVSPGSPVYERLNNNLQSLDKVLRDTQPVMQQINRKPNALIFGASQGTDPEPRKAK